MAGSELLRPQRDISALRPRLAAARAAQDWQAIVSLLEPVAADPAGHWPEEAHLSYAQALVRLDRLAEAQAAFDVIRRCWPGQLAGWRGTAEIATRHRDWGRAAQTWKDCLEGFPQQAVASWWSNLGNACRNLGRLDEAEHAFAMLRQNWPDQPAGWRGGAETATRRKDWPAVVQLWTECIARFPDQPSEKWWVALAGAYRQLGQEDEVQATLAVLKQRWPDSIETELAQARDIAATGNLARAARQWRAAARRFDMSANADLLSSYAAALTRGGYLDAAEQAINQFRSAFAGDMRWVGLRIELLSALGDERTAVAEISQMAADPAQRAALLQSFSTKRLSQTGYNAGLDLAEALDWLLPICGPEAEAVVDYQYLMSSERGELGLEQSRENYHGQLHRDWEAEYRAAKSAFVMRRHAQSYGNLVKIATAYADRAALVRLLSIGQRRFPRARATLQLAAMLSGQTVDAHSPAEAFSSRWRNILPKPPASIAEQVRGRPFRRLVCVLMVCNEDEMLPIFVDHYRRLGVESFIIIDNRSTRPASEVLADLTGVEITFIPTTCKFSASKHGMGWVNEILEAEICDWLLFADADELLLYPGSESLPLPRLLDHLEARNETALAAYMIDVYDRDYPAKGVVTDRLADHTVFAAVQDFCGQIQPPWRGVVNRARPAGAFSVTPTKVPLVRGGAGVRYTGNHAVTSCKVAETSGVFQHVKLFRDRAFKAMSVQDVLDDPRIRYRGGVGMIRHVVLAQRQAGDGDDHPFHLPFTPENLMRLGHMGADPDWRALLPQPMPQNRKAPAVAARSNPAILRTRRYRRFPLMDASLAEVILALQDLAALGHRAEIRLLMNAQIARLARPEVAAALVLLAAHLLGRSQAADRLLALCCHRIAAAGPLCAIAALHEIIAALGSETATARRIAAALATLQAVPAKGNITAAGSRHHLPQPDPLA